jgi:hypothetical protein
MFFFRYHRPEHIEIFEIDGARCVLIRSLEEHIALFCKTEPLVISRGAVFDVVIRLRIDGVNGDVIARKRGDARIRRVLFL